MPKRKPPASDACESQYSGGLCLVSRLRPSLEESERQGSKASQATAPMQEDLSDLLSMSSKECDQCGQNTHQYDQDCLPAFVYLQWSKRNKNSLGERVPKGRECYSCFDVRRRFYGLCDLDTLKQSRKQNDQEDERFIRLRKDKATGVNQYRLEAITDFKQCVTQKEETFDEAFTEGTSMPLMTFAKKNIDPALRQNEEVLAKYIKKHFNLQKIAKYFRTRSPVSAADVDGWRARELMAPLFMGDDEELQALIQAHLILPYLFGDFHPSHIQEYAGGLLFALEKPAKDGGGIRPIICGESWRRCFASLAANVVRVFQGHAHHQVPLALL